MTYTEYLRRRLHEQAGLEKPTLARELYALMERTEWSREFEQLMRNRMLMGALRYEPLADKQAKKGWDVFGYLRLKLANYEATGNLECLVDAANLCMIEFLCSTHPEKHFGAIDDTEEHCQQKAA